MPTRVLQTRRKKHPEDTAPHSSQPEIETLGLAMVEDLKEQRQYFEGRFRDLENEFAIIKARDIEQEEVNVRLMDIIEDNEAKQKKLNDLFIDEMENLDATVRGRAGHQKKSKKKSKKISKKNKKISKKRKKTKYKKKK